MLVIGDRVAEPDENFFVNLSSPTNGTIAEANETFYLDLFGNSSNSWFTKSRGIGTIVNDD